MSSQMSSQMVPTGITFDVWQCVAGHKLATRRGEGLADEVYQRLAQGLHDEAAAKIGEPVDLMTMPLAEGKAITVVGFEPQPSGCTRQIRLTARDVPQMLVIP